MTIKEAIEQIRTVVPANERSVFVTIAVKDYNHYAEGDVNRLQVTFSIWDERSHYEGPTLEMVVGQCLMANTAVLPDLAGAETAAIEAKAVTAEPSNVALSAEEYF